MNGKLVGSWLRHNDDDNLPIFVRYKSSAESLRCGLECFWFYYRGSTIIFMVPGYCLGIAAKRLS